MSKQGSTPIRKYNDHALITYYPAEVINRVIETHHCISQYAYIRHDVDEAQPHFHVIFHCSCNYTCSAVCGWFDMAYYELYPNGDNPQNTLSEDIGDRAKMYAYLTHSDPKSIQAGKHRYEESAIICNNPNFWKCVDQSKDDCMDILDDIIARVPIREMCKKYGRDFIIHYRQYLDMARLIYCEENPENVSHETKRSFEDQLEDYTSNEVY